MITSTSDNIADGGGIKRNEPMPPLSQDVVEFVQLEPEGTEKAMKHALEEGIAGEAGSVKEKHKHKVGTDGMMNLMTAKR